MVLFMFCQLQFRNVIIIPCDEMFNCTPQQMHLVQHNVGGIPSSLTIKEEGEWGGVEIMVINLRKQIITLESNTQLCLTLKICCAHQVACKM